MNFISSIAKFFGFSANEEENNHQINDKHIPFEFKVFVPNINLTYCYFIEENIDKKDILELQNQKLVIENALDVQRFCYYPNSNTICTFLGFINLKNLKQAVKCPSLKNHTLYLYKGSQNMSHKSEIKEFMPKKNLIYYAFIEKSNSQNIITEINYASDIQRFCYFPGTEDIFTFIGFIKSVQTAYEHEILRSILNLTNNDNEIYLYYTKSQNNSLEAENPSKTESYTTKKHKDSNINIFNPKKSLFYLFFKETYSLNPIQYQMIDASDVQQRCHHPKSHDIFTFIGFINKEQRDQIIKKRILNQYSEDNLIYEYVDSNKEISSMYNQPAPYKTTLCQTIFVPKRDLIYIYFKEQKGLNLNEILGASDIQTNRYLPGTNYKFNFFGFISKEEGIQALRNSLINLNDFEVKIYLSSSNSKTLTNDDLYDQPTSHNYCPYLTSFIPKKNFFYLYFTENQQPSINLSNKKYTSLFGVRDASDIQRFRYYPYTHAAYTFIGFSSISKLSKNITKSCLKSAAYKQQIYIYNSENKKLENYSSNQKAENQNIKNEDNNNNSDEFYVDDNSFYQKSTTNNNTRSSSQKFTSINNTNTYNQDVTSSNATKQSSNNTNNSKSYCQTITKAKNVSTTKQNTTSDNNSNPKYQSTTNDSTTNTVKQSSTTKNTTNSSKKTINYYVPYFNANMYCSFNFPDYWAYNTITKKTAQAVKSSASKTSNKKEALFTPNDDLYYVYFREFGITCKNRVYTNGTMFGISNIVDMKLGFKIKEEDPVYYTFFGFSKSIERSKAINTLRTLGNYIDVSSIRILEDDDEYDNDENTSVEFQPKKQGEVDYSKNASVQFNINNNQLDSKRNQSAQSKLSYASSSLQNTNSIAEVKSSTANISNNFNYANSSQSNSNTEVKNNMNNVKDKFNYTYSSQNTNSITGNSNNPNNATNKFNYTPSSQTVTSMTEIKNNTTSVQNKFNYTPSSQSTNSMSENKNSTANVQNKFYYTPSSQATNSISEVKNITDNISNKFNYTPSSQSTNSIGGNDNNANKVSNKFNYTPSSPNFNSSTKLEYTATSVQNKFNYTPSSHSPNSKSEMKNNTANVQNKFNYTPSSQTTNSNTEVKNNTTSVQNKFNYTPSPQSNSATDAKNSANKITYTPSSQSFSSMTLTNNNSTNTKFNYTPSQKVCSITNDKSDSKFAYTPAQQSQKDPHQAEKNSNNDNNSSKTQQFIYRPSNSGTENSSTKNDNSEFTCTPAMDSRQEEEEDISLFLPKFNNFPAVLPFITEFKAKEGLVYFFFAEFNCPSFGVVTGYYDKLFGINNASDIQRFRFYPKTKCVYTFIGFTDSHKLNNAIWSSSVTTCAVNLAVFDYPFKRPTNARSKQETSNSNSIARSKQETSNSNSIAHSKQETSNSNSIAHSKQETSNSSTTTHSNLSTVDSNSVKKRDISLLLPTFNCYNDLPFALHEFVPREGLFYFFLAELNKPNYRVVSEYFTKIFGVTTASDIQRFRYYPGTRCAYTFVGFTDQAKLKAAMCKLSVTGSALNKAVFEYPYKFASNPAQESSQASIKIDSNSAFYYAPSQQKQEEEDISLLLPKFNNFPNALPLAREFKAKEGLVYFFFAEINKPPSYVKSSYTSLFGIKNASDIQRFRFYPKTKCVYTFIGFTDSDKLKNAISSTVITTNAVNNAIYDYPFRPPGKATTTPNNNLQPNTASTTSNNNLQSNTASTTSNNNLQSNTASTTSNNNLQSNTASTTSSNTSYSSSLQELVSQPTCQNSLLVNEGNEEAGNINAASHDSKNVMNPNNNNNDDDDDYDYYYNNNEEEEEEREEAFFRPNDDYFYICFKERNVGLKSRKADIQDLFGVRNAKDAQRFCRKVAGDPSLYTFLGFSQSIDLNAAVNALKKAGDLVDVSSIHEYGQDDDSDDSDSDDDDDNDDDDDDNNIEEDVDEITIYSQDILQHVQRIKKVSPEEKIHFS